MKYCKECGVELDQSMESCPLCNVAASESENSVPGIGIEFPEKKQIEPLSSGEFTKNQKQIIFKNLALFILVSSIVATLMVDLVSSHNITWSKYTVTSCVVLFLMINLLYYFHHRPFMSITVCFLLVSLLFFIFGTSIFNVTWSFKLALPMLALIYISVLIMFLLAIYIKEQGINLVGCFFFITGMLTIGIEYCIDNFFSNDIDLSWSLYVAASAFCIAFILLFVHYRLKKGRELKRLFHY